MIASPALRKLALTVHVVCSVGWLGAVAAFLALAIAGLAGDGPGARSAYVAMGVVGSFTIVPLCVASVATGIVQSLGTPWGLFRHYWVVIKLVITLAATALLLLHMRVVDHLAQLAAEPSGALASAHAQRVQIVMDAGAAVVALVVTTALGTIKPRGLTKYGRRKQRESASSL